jgi:uncharacterized protein YbjT (DUF2867 family)
VPDDRVLLTGFPGPIALRLARRLLAIDFATRVTALVPRDLADDVATTLMHPRFQVLAALPSAPHFGLPAPVHRDLAGTVTLIHHVAGGLATTQQVVDFARAAPRLRRHHYVSTAYVSGQREGLVREDELAVGQTFDDAVAAEWFASEVLVAGASSDVPTTIHRPGLDAHETAERLLAPAGLCAALHLPLPQIGDGRAPLNAVPAAFVAEAVAAVTASGEALGRTLHLVPPDSVTVAEATQLLTEWAYGRPVAGRIPYPVAERALRTPGLRRALRRMGTAGALARLHRPVTFDTSEAAPLLERLGVAWPTFPPAPEAR